MRITILSFVFAAFIFNVSGAEFSRSSDFESVESFVAAAKSFEPITAKGDMSALFTVPEMGQPEDPKTGKPVAAPAIKSCDVLWGDDSFALVFVLAEPQTETTHSFVGVLFLLKQMKAHWQIADTLRFTAAGKEANISAKLTAGTGTGYHLGSEGMFPVVTVAEWNGGRGYSNEISASYSFISSKLKRLELK